MNKGNGSRLILPICILEVLLVLSSSLKIAEAHEDRDVSAGKYHFKVGFINEPPYQGLLNGVELTICSGQQCISSPNKDGTYTNGITGAFDTVKVEVMFGNQKSEIPLVLVPRNPGKYTAEFVPTRAGDYTFHIFGSLGQDKIDEKFTSGPNTFDSVLPLTAVQFPDKPGFTSLNSANTTAPVGGTPSAPTLNPTSSKPSQNSTTTAKTSSEAGNGVAVTTSSEVVPTSAAPTANSGNTNYAGYSELQGLKQQVIDQQKQVDEAKSSSSTATMFGLGGLVAGLIGLSLGGFVMLTKRGPGEGPEPG